MTLLWGRAKNEFPQVPPGTRVFIIGNGPSLRHTRLELLNGEHCWAVNQIHLIYDITKWRPTRVTFAEMTAGSPDWWPKIWASYDVNVDLEIQTFARDDAWWLKPELTELALFNACTHHDWRPGKRPEAWHLPQVCRYGGSVPMTIQLAVLHGYSKIYLLGCDLGFKPGSDNHFDENYADTHQIAENTNGINELRAWQLNGSRAAAHELAAKVSPVPIFNATIGGDLEAYPRVGLLDIL